MITLEEQKIFDECVQSIENHLKSEWPVIRNLQRMGKNKLYQKFGFKSLSRFAMANSKLSECVALTFVGVARAASRVPELSAALKAQRISVSKASRIVSILTSENAEEFIDFACKNSDRKVDMKVGRLNPKALPKDKVKVLSDTHILVTTVMTIEDFEKLKRVESLEAQKQKLSNLGTLIGVCAETHLEKHDPVRKARRSKRTLFKQSKARNRTAAEKHAVNLRDEGRCTYVDDHGVRCNDDRWVEHHHIHPYAHGGGNEPDNITTLGSFHHDLVHQMSFEFRDSSVPYVASSFTPGENERILLLYEKLLTPFVRARGLFNHHRVYHHRN